jgi:probable rRNA maturation factor
MLALDVVLAADGWSRHDLDWTQRTALWARTALQEAGAGAVLSGARPVVLDVLYADNGELQRLNRQWRGIDQPTNVLSFPSGDDLDGPADAVQPRSLGDIALAYETVADEAVAQAKTLEHHCAHMVIHGVFHLLGLDHETDAQAEQMEMAERRALARLGIADPYAAGPIGH